MKKFLLLIALILLLTTACVNKYFVAPPEQERINSESKNAETNNESNYEQSKHDAIIAPDFELETLDGGKIRLSDMRDKYVMINFWATWCGFCVVEMPDLQKLQEKYQDDLLILAVNVGESKEDVQAFMDKNNLNLTVVLDEKMNVANTYGIRSYPTTISVNKKGEAIRGYVGMLTYEQMEQLYSFFEEE
jgi:thiol-disulfide isomerase/thioredoxin